MQLLGEKAEVRKLSNDDWCVKVYARAVCRLLFFSYLSLNCHFMHHTYMQFVLYFCAVAYRQLNFYCFFCFHCKPVQMPVWVKS